MMRKILLILLTALMVFASAQTSQAALSAVDPGPYTAATGFFPLYYTDTAATTLDLCLSKTVIPANAALTPPILGGPACVLLPNPGIFNDTLPIVFPVNFPDESFYFTADANVTGSGVDLVYLAHLEAAFGGGVPAPNDQMTFARIRIVPRNLPAAGTYTITHPYGVETFVAAAAGGQKQVTRDIGIGAPGVFTGALAGDIGPFLVDAGGTITVGTETFVGDPNSLRPVVGGPNGNVVRVQGPGGIDVQTDLFAISGRIWNGQRPTAVTVDRSTYSRTAVGPSQVDVFATSTATATATFRNDLTSLTETPMTADGAGKFYGQSANPAAIPTHVIVTADDTTTTPTPLASPVVDIVKLTKAEYSLATKTLVIEASSSDETVPPALTALGFGTLTRLAPTALQRFVALNVPEPPARITVKSSAGGSDTENVVVIPTATNLTPIARDDAATTGGTTPVTINVVANDVDFDGTINAQTVAIVTPPANGTVLNNGNGTVTYTANAAPASVVTDTFTYTVNDNLGALSNVATVTVTVNPVNQVPIAGNDAASTNQGVTVTITVLINDSDPDNNTPLTVANLTQPAAGTGTVVLNANQSVTYTPPTAAFVGTTTFTYQARDSLGALSAPATVTVTVLNVGPVAVNDSATTVFPNAVVINVIANDTDANGIAPTTVAIVTGPTRGTVAVNATTGAVTYTPTVGPAPYQDSFTYTVRDTLGGLSNVATVTVNVSAAVETITIKTAQYTLRTTEWNVSGSSTQRVGNTMTIYLGPRADNREIGTALVGANGSWQFRQRVSGVVAQPGNIVTVVSSFGNSATRTVQIK